MLVCWYLGNEGPQSR